MTRALILDCDGVLGDTEPHGHRVAFNAMWREAGVAWEWSVEAYGRWLRIAGGKERMAALLDDPAFRRRFTPPTAMEDRRQLLARWHARKSALFQDEVRSGRIPPRSGVRRLVGEAGRAGWKLAVASTSARESVEAMLVTAVGPGLRARFDQVLAGDIVARKKPAPDLNQRAAEALALPVARCLVIEDSAIGLQAAVAAGMRCVVTPSTYTTAEDFTAAQFVVSCLGDPGGEPCRVLANRSRAVLGPWVRLEDLAAVLDG